MWKRIINPPTHPYSGKRIPHLGTKFSTNMKEWLKEEIHGPPILNRWKKIGALNKGNHHLVDWESLKGATTITTNQFWRWGTRITAQEPPTVQTMKLIVKWPTSDRPRGCGHTRKEILHILKLIKSSILLVKITKIIGQWGHCNKAPPHLLTTLPQGI